MPSPLRNEQRQINDRHVDLLARVSQYRDKKAFTELFSHFGPMLKGFMMRKGADAELAEDLAQDTMIQVWRKAALYSPGKGSVSTWIFTIARNLRVDTFRRIRGLRFEDIAGFEFESDGPSSEQMVSEREESGLVAEAVTRLPPEQREVIQLAFADDLTQLEIAERLGQPLGTVKSRMRLAYHKLSAALEELR